jgi:hypothetical protein
MKSGGKQCCALHFIEKNMSLFIQLMVNYSLISYDFTKI